MSNLRTYFAVKEAAFAKVGETSYTAVHGLQSIGISTKYGLEQVFEIGQLAIYDNAETVPDVEVSLEKCLDGYPLVYHLATRGALSGSLSGRSNIRSILGLSIFGDVQDSASGTPIAQCTVSGLFPSSLNYNFQVNGPFSESVTLVGNNKTWLSTFTAPTFNNTDSPLAGSASGNVNRRQDFILGESATTASKIPQDIPGVSSSGYVPYSTTLQQFGVHLQSVKVQCNLGREQLLELGRRGPYHRFVQFPVEVKCDFECIATAGESSEALEASSSNLTNRTIFLRTREGTTLDLGTRNKLASVTYGGGNAGTNGGNDTATFSFTNFNDLIVASPSDPSGL